MKRLILACIGCFFLTWQASEVKAGQFTQLVAFGDSLTDVGNLYHVTNNTFPVSPPYDQGRFSDGPVWLEELASRMGLPAPLPSTEGGTDFAFAGAETHSASGLSTKNTPNLDTQIGSYLGLHSTFTGNQLIVVWGGANDFLNARQTNPSIPVSNLAAEITDIANHGGKYFLVPNLPPLGITPDVRSLGSAAVTSMNSLSIQFDSMLASEENTLEASLGIKIFRLDVASLSELMIHIPGAFGLTNVTGQALQNGSFNEGLPGPVAPNPDQYLFWDGVHPTQTVHKIVGDAAFALLSVPERRDLDPPATGRRGEADLALFPVPEPSALSMAGIATLIGLAYAWRSRWKALARA